MGKPLRSVSIHWQTSLVSIHWQTVPLGSRRCVALDNVNACRLCQHASSALKHRFGP